MAYWKLNDVRAALEEAKGRPVSPQLARDYTLRKTFPAPSLIVGEKTPERIWCKEDVEEWLFNRFPP